LSSFAKICLSRPIIAYDANGNMVAGGGRTVTSTSFNMAIHARQNKRVSEEALSRHWRRKLTYAFCLFSK